MGVTSVTIRVSRMANKFYGCNQCDYKSKQYSNMCAHVMQAHFDVKDVPFQCPICGACKATKNAFRSHHRQYHKGLDYKPLGSGVAMTELDFIPKHFLPIELLPGTSSDCQLAAEPSVDVPAEPVGAAYPVPESSADVPAEQEGVSIPAGTRTKHKSGEAPYTKGPLHD